MCVNDELRIAESYGDVMKWVLFFVRMESEGIVAVS